MLADPASEVKRIASFLKIDANNDLVAKVVAGSSFDSMKLAAQTAAEAGGRSNTDAHLRAGQSCKWRSHFYKGVSEGSNSEEEIKFKQAEGDRLKALVTDAFDQALGGSGARYAIGKGQWLE